MRNAIVTGGSRGLGLGIVRKLIESGFRAIVIARKQSDKLAETRLKLEQTYPGSLHFVPFDLAQIEGIPDLVKKLRKEFGPIYGLVNNAGMSADGMLALTPTNQIEQVVRLNTVSPMVLTKHVVRFMMADGGGRIVNISSVTAFTGYSGLAVYAATKASLIGFTRSLAREVGRTGVTVNAVAPGFVMTDMTEAITEENRQQIARRSALKRLVDVEDVANAVDFLLSDRSKNITGTVITVDAGEHGMMTVEKPEAASAGISPAKAWLRALEMTAPIARDRFRILPTVIEEVAARMGDAPALLSDRESLTYSGLAKRANQYARWALDQGLAKGDVVCLLMTNRPEYFAVWLGITSVGVVVSLLNTNLAGSSLAHCIRIVAPRQIIASAEFLDTLTPVLPQLGLTPSIWAHGPGAGQHSLIDQDVEGYSCEPLSLGERRSTSIDDRALYIYTSGTTGLPKAANVSHARAMQWSHWFAGMMDVQPTDRMYNCLPTYHSVGGVQVIGAMLVGGGNVVIREKFSASSFWNDIVRWDCSLFEYIGELCRYLMHTETSANETQHRIRLACGNGLAPEVWEAFKDRFRIPQILEFYAATEGSVSLFNIQGKSGAIGHIPPYLSHRFSPALVLIDVETGEPARNEEGFCTACATNQVGEALGKVMNDQSSIGSRFEGYTSTESSEKKILHNVFKPGDAWFRTGDLMRRDEKGYYYFVDRIGDTFRRKGENVATTEVAGVIGEFPGIKHANVYGVAVPGVEGRVGMAAVVADGGLNMGNFRKHLEACLPSYARPVFLRIRNEVDLTGTFKYSKTEFIRQGYDPDASADPLYFDNSQEFVPLDKDLYYRIQGGEFRL